MSASTAMGPPPGPNNPCSVSLRIFPSRLPQRDFCPVLISTFRGVEIARILNPDLGEPFFSASRIFLACSISPVDGLIRFDLQLPFSYDVSLANLAPWDDIWVTLKTARRIAAEFDILSALDPLLDVSSKKAWATCEWVMENTRVKLMQNWRAKMCDRQWAPFYKVDVQSEKFVTLLDVAEMQRLREPLASVREHACMAAWEKTTVWSSYAYEEWRDHKAQAKGLGNGRTVDGQASPADPFSLQVVFPKLLYDATFGLEELIATCAPDVKHAQPKLGSTSKDRARHSIDLDPAAKDNLQSVLALSATFGRMVIQLRRVSLTIDKPDSANMRDWLNQLPSPRALRRPELTPPSSPPPMTAVAKLTAERDALAQTVSRMERKQEKLLDKLSRLSASEQRVRDLEARLTELEESGELLSSPSSAEVAANGAIPHDNDADAEEDEEELLMPRVERRSRRKTSPEKRRSESPGSDSAATIRPNSPVPERMGTSMDVKGVPAKRSWSVLSALRSAFVGILLALLRVALYSASGAILVIFVAAWIGPDNALWEMWTHRVPRAFDFSTDL